MIANTFDAGNASPGSPINLWNDLAPLCGLAGGIVAHTKDRLRRNFDRMRDFCRKKWPHRLLPEPLQLGKGVAKDLNRVVHISIKAEVNVDHWGGIIGNR